MGHDAFSPASTVVYVGLARLPQPLISPAPTLAVELEVELRARKVVAVTTNLGFSCLDRLLTETLVGRPVAELSRSALLEIEVRYSAPFAAALRMAVQSALCRAIEQPAKDNRVAVPRVFAVNGDARALAGPGSFSR